MQKLKSGINFTKEAIASLNDNYARTVFCDAIRLLLKEDVLSQEEKRILAIATGKTYNMDNFYSKSFIIYLCNGILWEKEVEKIESIKKQLMFELAISILHYNLEKKVHYNNEDKNLFSLFLNQQININFDSIAKKAKFYIFYKGTDEVLRIEKNKECAITEDIDFLEQDKNPFNENNDHPDAPAFTPYDLGNVQKEEWVRQFRSAYRIIKEKVPEIYGEIYNFLDSIVPHGYEKGKQLSSSYSKSPGILYLSYTDKDITQAEAIIHEVHHTIFNVVLGRYKLVNNDRSLRYYSAYRPDARHIHGCFIGLHAFVAVQNFYRKLAESEKDQKFIEKFFLSYLKNAKTISVLDKYGDFTGEGNQLFEGIKAKYHYDGKFFGELKNKYVDVYEEAKKIVEKHLEDAKRDNEVLLY